MSKPIQRARFIGGPEDGLGVETDDELDTLPDTLVADGGDAPVGYRLVRGVEGEVWRYVVDPAVADVYLKEIWAVDEEGEDGK